MLVKRVLIFIKDLKELSAFKTHNSFFHDNFEEIFSDRYPHLQLDSDDIQILLSCFKSRWKKIVDTEIDYTLNSGVVNQKWIQFAKDLAPFTEKSYLQILIPDITNSVDYNNLSQLSETVRLENFYLGHSKNVLYRKRGLCEHLIEKQFLLSTCRDLRTRKLSALSVEELTRLKSSKQINSEFSIKDEQFTNFWDFLRKKVFIKLQSLGELPMDLLPHLLRLIEQYYALKKDGSDFKVFKKAFHQFLRFIYRNKLEDINFFYGVEIQYKEKVYYLLDFLILINKAQSYVLDEHLNTLINWLYQLHPALKLKNKELEPIYNKLLIVGLNVSRDEVLARNAKEEPLGQCMRLLLSLFTSEFEMLPLTGDKISIWDMTNTVFSGANEIFSLLKPLLTMNREDELLPQYRKVMKEHIMPAKFDLSFCTWMTRYNSTINWYKHVESNSLSKIGVFWFQTELLIHTLLRFSTHDSHIAEQINKFLDELIHTYAQDKYELLKQFRVNILFSTFMKGLPIQERKHLLILLQLYDQDVAKDNFIANCIYHIMNRLSHISTVKKGGAIHFFSDMYSVDIARLVITEMHFDHLNKVIDAFKAQLYSPKFILEIGLLDKMMIYLRSLSRPILTNEEAQDSRSSASTLDYLGAST